VRSLWEKHLATHTTIKLKDDSTPMHNYLFIIAKDFADKKITDKQVDKKLKEIFEIYLVDEKTTATKK
jgi:hypothetical protein